MSDERSKLRNQGEEVLNILKRGADFTKELLQENERLRRRLATLEDTQQLAAQNPQDWDKLRIDLVGRIHSLEEENRGFRAIMLNFNSERLGMAASATGFARVCAEDGRQGLRQ